jgi:glycosyltransferase involved in cell wall biosynthesis
MHPTGAGALKVRLFHTLPAEGRTSSEVYARELAAALQGLGTATVRISHCQPESHWRSALGGGPRPLSRLAGYVDRYARYQRQARAARRADRSSIDHVVDHGYGHLVFSLDPRRTLVTFHDAMLLKLEARELPIAAYPRFTILGHKLSLRAIRRSARVIAVSVSSRRDLLRFTDYPPERVRVVPQGVAACFRPPAPVAREDPSDGPLRILHVGHCGPYKNVEGILRALPPIRRRVGRPVHFVKVGGPFTASQQALIERLGVRDAVEHRGTVPLADLPGAYAAADLLLMPSLYEGFGLPALEAMACGTPVVASTEGALPEVLGDAGLLVLPTDVEAIAAAVARVLTDERLRADLRQRGLARAREFTWERTARETLAVYREVYEEAS